MNGRADVARGSFAATNDPEPRSGVGPAPRPYVSGWTMGSYLEFGALPSAVPSARLHARLVVGEWGLGELADTLELIVSELVTNGIQAAKGLTDSWWQGRWIPGVPPVRLWLQADDSHVLIQVWDGSDRLPEQQQSEPHRERGRGLLLVEALSTGAGTYVLDRSSGKVVWAEIGYGST
jgi:anti-sigma regulatory factor (Ser/Thr protein kinase)